MFSNNDDGNDENLINSKRKNEDQTSSFGNNIINFFITTFINLLAIVIQFILGALILFGCKVSQSNILPTDIKSEPYTEVEPNINPIQTNIFIKTFSNLSKKLSFPYKNEDANINNSKYFLIDILRNEKKESKSNVTNFFISLLEGLFSFNYSSIAFVLQLINYLPEFLILFIGPLIFLLFSLILLIFNNFYLIYLWIFNLGWFFKTKKDETWVKVDNLLDYFWSMFVAFMFFILMWVLLCFFIPFTFLSFFTFMWSLITVFLYKGIMDNSVVSVANIIVDVFKYYKTIFMTLFTFLFILNTFSFLGTIPGIFSIIAIILILFGFIKIDIFDSYTEDYLSPLVPTEKAKRMNVPEQTGGGFLNNLFDDPKTILNSLKKINRMNKSKQNINLQKEEFFK